MKKLFFVLSIIFLFTPVVFSYAAVPIKILLVPGHDKEIWGAQYGNVKEAAMNLAVASRIRTLLKKDNRFEIYITRNIEGYTKEFAEYFSTKREEIISFKDNARAAMQNKIASGNFIVKENVLHVTVTQDTSVILYGINKWASENKMDAVIHIHFNDYPRKTSWTKGKYKGFAVYIPDGELANWKESGQLAANIFIQLKKKYITSTYEKELGGLVPDQKLIALGANGTLDASVRSILIEYGYIYRFENSEMRHKSYDTMAGLTVAGIKNYFFVK